MKSRGHFENHFEIHFYSLEIHYFRLSQIFFSQALVSMKRVREIFFRRKAIRQEPQSEALVACLIFGLIFHGLMLEMHTLRIN